MTTFAEHCAIYLVLVVAQLGHRDHLAARELSVEDHGLGDCVGALEGEFADVRQFGEDRGILSAEGGDAGFRIVATHAGGRTRASGHMSKDANCEQEKR